MNWLFAWRYFRAGKSTNAINIIAWISMIAIAVGTAALIIVLSVFNGFEDLVKGLYADFYADMRMIPASGKTFHISSQQIQQIAKTKGVAVISYVAEEKAVLNGVYQSIVTLKGVDAQYTAINKINTPQHIIRGKFLLGDMANPQLVVGAGIESAAGVDVERGIYPAILFLPNKQAAKLSGDDGLNSFKVLPSGTFAVQQDFDNKYVFIGHEIYEFKLKNDDIVEEYYSAVGNNDVPYPVILGKKNVYYMLDKKYVQRKYFPKNMQSINWESSYDKFYGKWVYIQKKAQTIDSLREYSKDIKNVKVIDTN